MCIHANRVRHTAKHVATNLTAGDLRASTDESPKVVRFVEQHDRGSCGFADLPRAGSMHESDELCRQHSEVEQSRPVSPVLHIFIRDAGPSPINRCLNYRNAAVEYTVLPPNGLFSST